MKYSGEFGACKITFMILYLCWISSIDLDIQSIKKCLNVSFHSLLNVEEVKFFILL